MKILEIVNSIPPTKLSADNARKGCSGYDIITYEIASRLGKFETNEVYMHTLVQFHKEKEQDNIIIFSNSMTKVLTSFHLLLSLKTLWRLRKFWSFNKRDLRKILFVSATAGYISKLIRVYKPDIIHNHGCSYLIELLRILKEQYKIPIVVSLHGLISFGGKDGFGVENATLKHKQYERYVISRAQKIGEIVTFVSTGCIHQLQKWLSTDNTPTFITTLNGCELNSFSQEKINIRKIYGLSEDSKILLYVGNISEHKNQQVILKALPLLPVSLRNNCYVLFLGGVQASYKVEWDNILSNSNCQSQIIQCGFVAKELLDNYFEQANGVLLLSLSEGFGLSIIEGMSHGLPSLISENMDIVPDVKDTGAIILTDQYSPENVAIGIEHLLTYKWDGEEIKKQSSRFSMERMAESYNKVLYKVVNNRIKE